MRLHRECLFYYTKRRSTIQKLGREIRNYCEVHTLPFGAKASTVARVGRGNTAKVNSPSKFSLKRRNTKRKKRGFIHKKRTLRYSKLIKHYSEGARGQECTARISVLHSTVAAEVKRAGAIIATAINFKMLAV